MSMAGVRGLEQDLSGADLHQRGQDLGHVDVADMGALVVAPADVDADLVLGQATQRMVQRLDVGLGHRHELLVRKVGEEHVAREGEVGAVHLEVEPGLHDGAVLVAHRVGQGGEVGLARG
jgi:hypothetical protein